MAKNKKPTIARGLCDLVWIQTRNLLIRSQMLYSVELRGHLLLLLFFSFLNLLTVLMLYSVELRGHSFLRECKDSNIFL